MTGTARLLTASAVGGLMLLVHAAPSDAQHQAVRPNPIGQLAAFGPGSVFGVVTDERGVPVAGAMVSAVGSVTTFAVTDQSGRFELSTLTPGPYLLRAHRSGFAAPRGRMIDVRASARTSSSIALTRLADAHPILAAGVAIPAEPAAAVPNDPEETGNPPANSADAATKDDRGETAWRIGHVRRGILKDASIPEEFLARLEPNDAFVPLELLGRAVGSPARLATSFFADTPFSGQVNLLTTSSFNTPQQLFSRLNAAHGIAYVRVGAPVGSQGDWTVRGAITQADISAWILAGSYATRAPARHRYDIGMSYSTQRYDGGNPLARRDVADGSRNAGTVYGFDTFTITPALSLTYGGRYAQYDYLEHRALLSPRVAVSLSPAESLRIKATLSSATLAPGAEEFLPPGDSGIWLPPQRTFSSLEPSRILEAERTTHLAVEVEQDLSGLGESTVAFGAFRQRVDNQLVTLFGAEMPARPVAKIGHYLISNAGDVSAAGCSASFRTTLINRLHGSIAYSVAKAQLVPDGDVRYLILLAPSALRPTPEHIHDVSTSIQADVPETSTHVLVLYRVSNAFARAASSVAEPVPDRAGFDARFDVQVRQSLPFLDFTSAKWEMLVAVRNFFREAAADQSVYDELLAMRPPKRIVGGVTVHF
jgi:TonB-dependent receptor-like protein/carboxypeptidase family protein